MSDEELIARLRDWPYQGETMAGEAADRIAALTAQLAEEQAHSERQASGHREDLNEIADVSVKRQRRAVKALGIREMVAGWNGEGKDEHYTPHPAGLGVTIKTTCGLVYALDAAITEGGKDG